MRAPFVRISTVASLAIIAGLSPAWAQPQTIRNAERGFSFAVPDGYRENVAARQAPNVIYAFARGHPTDASSASFRIEALGGPIGREPLIHERVERAARESVARSGIEITRFDYRHVQWKGFDLELAVSFLTYGERRLVTLGTQVPLAREAIQIYFVAPEAAETRAVADLQQVLASLEGETNWVSDHRRSESLGRLIGIVIVLVAAGIVLWLRARRNAQSKRA